MGLTQSQAMFEERMAKIAKGGDAEKAHKAADELMCGVLETIGYGDAIKIFREMQRWYS